MAKFLGICLFLTLLLFFPPQTFATNLLLNSSFEEVSSDTPTSWVKNVSTMSLSLFSPGSEGVNAAAINKQNNTTGSIYIYQDVDVEPESYYKLTGKIQKNSSAFSYAILRISWRGTSGEVSKTDSPQLSENALGYKDLSIDAVQAPLSAIKARIELLGNIVTPNPQTALLFDQISFTQISAPEQPPVVLSPTSSVLTPTPTPTPTKIPTPTSLKTPTPTTVKSPTPSLAKTPTTTLSPTQQSSSSAETMFPEEEVLGTTEMISPTPTIIVQQLAYEDNRSSVSAVILMGIGGFLLLGCAIIIYRSWREQKG